MSNTVLCTMVSGKFYTIEFIKLDGTIRKINGRFGVTKYLKGAESRDITPEYVTIWTRNKSRKFDACRNISRSQIVSIRAEGYDVKMNNASAYKRTIKA